MNSIGNRIKKLRTSNKITQKRFGEMFDLAESTIGMYERDERKPDYETLCRIADYFGVTTDELLGRNVNQLEKDNADNDEEEFFKWMDDPTTDLFFKEYLESPDEMKEQLRKIWDIIKQQQK